MEGVRDMLLTEERGMLGGGVPLKKPNPSTWTFSSTESNNIFHLCMHEYVCVCVCIQVLHCVHACLAVCVCQRILMPVCVNADCKTKGKRGGETQRKRAKEGKNR